MWFEADFTPIDSAIAVGRRAAADGCRVVLATNQEHRRAAFLRVRLRIGVEDDRRVDVVFVDDVEHNVVCARAAGWQAVHAAPGASPTEWITEVEQLLDL